jgi:hypothetical protein
MELPCEGETSEMRKSFTAGRNLLPVVGFFCKYFASISRVQKDFPVVVAKVTDVIDDGLYCAVGI